MAMNTNSIGNYIHYNYDNYLKYGLQIKGQQVTRPRGELERYLKESRDATQSRLYASRANMRAQTLQKYLNDFQTAAASSTNIAPNSGLQQVIMKHFNEIFNHITAADIDWSTFQLTPEAKKRLAERRVDEGDVRQLLGNAAPLLKVQTLTKSSLGSRGAEQGTARLAAYNAQVQNLRAAFEVLKKKVSTGTSTMQELETHIQKLEQAKLNLTRTIDVSQGSGVFRTGPNGVSSEYSLVELIQLTAKAIYVQSCVSMIEGTLFESALAAAAEALKTKGAEGFNTIKEALVTGLSTAGAAVQHDNFSKHIAVKDVVSKSHNITKSNGVVSYTVGAQQGKVDVRISDNTTRTGISAKSYNMSATAKTPNIQLVNNTTLLYMFQKKGQFFNHYLNQTVKTVSNSAVVTQSNEIMKQMILLEAIAGGGIRINEQPKYRINQLAVSIFALNDKSKPGGIKIVPVSQLFSVLVERSASNDALYDINLSSSHRWPNVYAEDSKWKRITSLLQAVHSHKIKASVKKSAFNFI